MAAGAFAGAVIGAVVWAMVFPADNITLSLFLTFLKFGAAIGGGYMALTFVFIAGFDD